ncbi:hypothetical protein CEXT_262331 [Caerostris extrusa]|uniref:Uncharacterized protein n=1 Tax=Caerostris extrusa TaxID=172846 RepID=A0AAV4QIY8_CAEEX|nr:hypothetical protein CEXT_262331 [Caerostris extrusa]
MRVPMHNAVVQAGDALLNSAVSPAKNKKGMDLASGMGQFFVLEKETRNPGEMRVAMHNAVVQAGDALLNSPSKNKRHGFSDWYGTVFCLGKRNTKPWHDYSGRVPCFSEIWLRDNSP